MVTVPIYLEKLLYLIYYEPMKLVLLAAGKGKRMGESSNHTPKPLLEYKGKSLIEHKLEDLPESIKEIIIIIGHLGEKIKQAFGDVYLTKKGISIPIKYVEQQELLGTAHALFQAKEHLMDSPFIVLMGDDLYSPKDLESITKHHEETGEWSVILQNSDVPMSAGKCITDKRGNLVDIVEDPEGIIPINKMYTGGCLLTPEIFDIAMVKLPNSVEFGLPQTFVSVSKERNIKAFDATFWKRITSPEDLLE
jgi:NDP-sugar pyrophosphorylase family protein